MIRAWRNQLVHSAQLDDALGSIASQMATLVAARSLGSLGHELGAIGSSGGVLHRVMGQVALDAGLWSRSLADDLSAIIRPFARLASVDWASRARSWTEDYRRSEEKLRALGWWVSPSMPLGLPNELVAVAATGGRRQLSREICAYYAARRSRALTSMIDTWIADPAFKRRQAILRDGAADHRRGRYRVSIPTLLPHIEGIAMEVFTPGARDTNPANRISLRLGDEGLHGLMAASLVDTLTLLWSKVDFAAVSPYSRTLNRHAVLHGRTLRYARRTRSAFSWPSISLRARSEPSAAIAAVQLRGPRNLAGV